MVIAVAALETKWVMERCARARSGAITPTFFLFLSAEPNCAHAANRPRLATSRPRH